MKNLNSAILLFVAVVMILGLIMPDNSGKNKNGTTRNQGYPVQDVQVSKISFSDMVKKLDNGQINKIIINRAEDSVIYTTEGTAAYVYIPPEQAVLLDSNKADIVFNTPEKPQKPSFVASLFASLFPFLIMIVLYFVISRVIMKRMGGSGGPMGVGKTKAQLIAPENINVTFDDVAGADEAKEDLVEIIDFLKNPSRFAQIGAKIPKGILMSGPPGTGKTLLAKATASEAGVPFFATSGSDFVEMFVGVGASRVRDMFVEARKNAPCIIFIDELDAIGGKRASGAATGSSSEHDQTLNAILVEMDGFAANEGVIIMGATNRPENLDDALVRPGRFDRQVTVGLPDLNGRTAILDVHIKKVRRAANVDTRVIARGTPGFSGAELANLVNEAALFAARRQAMVVTNEDIELAKDKILMGAEKRSLLMSDEERRITAYHEAGHAIIALKEKASDPVHKATIIPRGRALGMVVRLPERDSVSQSLNKLHADLAVAMGGRVAEELTFGEDNVTTGASGDFQMVYSYARKMVVEWGLSEVVGPLNIGNQQSTYPGGGNNYGVSEALAEKIDSEIRRIADEAMDRARAIIQDNHDAYTRIAEALLQFETLTGEELQIIADGGELADKIPDVDIGPVSKRRKSFIPLVPRTA